MFNWKNTEVYNVPYKFAICDNFLETYNDNLFPTQQWCDEHLLTRENSVTKAISAKHSVLLLQQKQKFLLEAILSQDFHNKVCRILDIPLVDESIGIRKTKGEYRIAREAMFVQLLESVHSSEAELLIRAKDRILHKKLMGITRKLCQDAFPGLIAK